MELFIGVFQQRMDILKISREKFPYSSNYVVSGLHHEYVPVINDFLANCWKRFLGVSCSLGRGIWGGMESPVKLDGARKVWYLLLRVFWLLLPGFNFWRGDWALGYVSSQIWDFPNMSLFPKILILFFFFFLVVGLMSCRSATLEATRIPSLLY